MPSTGKSDPRGRTPVADVLGKNDKQLWLAKEEKKRRHTGSSFDRHTLILFLLGPGVFDEKCSNWVRQHTCQTSFRVPHITRAGISEVVFNRWRLTRVMYSRMCRLDTGYHCLRLSSPSTGKRRQGYLEAVQLVLGRQGS